MKILFISTWFPYPLDQGSRIRAYHLLRALATRHEVTLVSFARDPVKPAWRSHLEEFCSSVETVAVDPFETDHLSAGLNSLSLKPRAALTTYSVEMERCVREIGRSWRPDAAVSLTFVTAPYALQLPGILHIVDVDNLVARMLYDVYRAPARPVERARRWLAWQKFRHYENRLFGQFDLCLAVSPPDRAVLQATAGLEPAQLALVPNGVDVDYNAPSLAPVVPNTLIYSGALTYNANYDAMAYFLAEIWPLIRAQQPGARLQITGSTRGVDLGGLALTDQVQLAGYLDDVRPAVASSWASVVPLRVGGGTRLKILEAMALGTPVISTSKGAEGLDVQAGEHLLTADTPQAFAEQTVGLLRQPALRARLAANARRLVEQRYSWHEIGRQFAEAVENAFEAKVQGRRI